MSNNAIYLSGNEYNRILSPDPLEPRYSALPAEILWNGAAQFWLFEHVYCTKESLECEAAAADQLGWATGKIFLDLQRKGFLKSFDWSDLRSNTVVLEELGEVHAALRLEVDQNNLLAMLRARQDGELEALKLRLLKPILKHCKCVQSISINSISHWSPEIATRVKADSAMTSALNELVDQVGKAQPGYFAFELCRPPGTGISQDQVTPQLDVERRIQAPMIPDLFAGRLTQADYFTPLKPSASVYAPINEQLWRDYREHIEVLERLRDIAKENLWRDLHNDWLPRLESDPTFLPQFRSLLSDALLRARFEPYLTRLAMLIFTSAACAIGKLVPFAGGLTGVALAGLYEERKKRIESLTLFFQKAIRP